MTQFFSYVYYDDLRRFKEGIPYIEKRKSGRHILSREKGYRNSSLKKKKKSVKTNRPTTVSHFTTYRE